MEWCAQKTEENEKRGRKNSKKNLTEPTLLEITGFVYQDLKKFSIIAHNYNPQSKQG